LDTTLVTIARRIERIHTDVQAAAIAVLKRAEKHGVQVSQPECDELELLIEKHRCDLLKLMNASPIGQRIIHLNFLGAKSTRVCALLRSLLKRKSVCWSVGKILSVAKKVDRDHATNEPVVAFWLEDPAYKPRPITRFGMLRQARLIAIREVLIAMGVGSEFDYAQAEAGGEREFVHDVCERMADGYDYWIFGDVANCYPSLQKEHIAGLPIKDGLISEAFLREDVKIVVKTPKNLQRILDHLQAIGVSSPVTTKAMHDMTAQMVRQGLPQGSPLSPLLASYAIARNIKCALANAGVVVGTYADDLAIGAPDASTVEAAGKLLSKTFFEGPAAIGLHNMTVVHKSNAVGLEYVFEPGNGHAGNPVHVKPGPKRILRKMIKLTRKLNEWKATELDYGVLKARVKNEFWRPWYGSQQGWTKVPFHSESVSKLITLSYVDDYLDGIPMGTHKLGKPMIENLSSKSTKKLS
jgi:hypothetical protein